jgi:hypothetical protein
MLAEIRTADFLLILFVVRPLLAVLRAGNVPDGNGWRGRVTSEGGIRSIAIGAS